MKKLSLLALLLSSSLSLAAPSFTVGGVVLDLPSVQQGGKLYVDAAALARALGFTLTFDQSKNSYVFQAQAPAGAGGNGQLAGGSAAVGGVGASASACRCSWPSFSIAMYSCVPANELDSAT